MSLPSNFNHQINWSDLPILFIVTFLPIKFTSTFYGEEKIGLHMKNDLSKDKVSSTIKNTGKIDS